MKNLWIAPLLAVSLAGCGTVAAINVPLSAPPLAAPPTTAIVAGAPQDLLIGSPTTPVQSATLPPVSDFDRGPTAPTGAPTSLLPNATTTLTPAPTQTAAATPTGGAVTVGRTDLLGGWTVTSGGDTCMLFMTLTAWTGGYRASTRGCLSPVLSTISAWDLQGSTVVLSTGEGTPVARLQPRSTTRFEGTLTSGPAVVFFR